MALADGGGAFVASDGQGSAFTVDQGRATPLDVGAADPIVSISASAGWYIQPQWWAGRTSSGQLVLGSYERGVVCDGEVERVTMDYLIGYSVKRGDVLVSGFMGCVRATLPSGVSGMGTATCGIASNPFVFDEHRVFAAPYECLFD